MKIKPTLLAALFIGLMAATACAGPQFSFIVTTGGSGRCAPRPVYCAPVIYQSPVCQPAYARPVVVYRSAPVIIRSGTHWNDCGDAFGTWQVRRPVKTRVHHATAFRWRR